MRPLDGTVTAGGKRVGHQDFFLREEATAGSGENPPLIP